MAATDSYATAKANLRDTVKTLVGIFSGIAGLLMAGTPFTGYGNLDPSSDGYRWWIATAGLAAAVVLVGVSILWLLRLLQPDVVYQSVLRKQVDLTPYGRADRAEIEALRQEFNLRKADLLPDIYGSIDDLAAATIEALNDLTNTQNLLGHPGAPPEMAAHIENRRKHYERLDSNLTAINQWAGYSRMRIRIVWGCNRAFVLGFLSLVAIGVFSWAVGSKPEKEPPASSTQILVVPSSNAAPLPAAAQMPTLAPIQFETGRAALLPDGIAELEKARNYLRTYPQTAILVFAYTDTRGGSAVNRALATQRAQAVRRALTAEGGISASRVFVAELPETDLPSLTGRAVDQQSNRSVHLMLLVLPSRGP